jgi:serine/threonine protein phosphatase PrpC
MKYAFHVETDTGQVRHNNEDAAAFDAGCGLCVLADGMGGYNAGEVASSLAVSAIRSELVDWLMASGGEASVRDIRRMMESSARRANQAILDAARADPSYAGMGTTLVIAVFWGQRLLVGHIGDSRVYRLRQGQLRQLTRDHSLLQEQLDAGVITPAQAAVSAQRNLVTRALGIDAAVELELGECTVEPDDLYLICSDGLSDMLDDARIADILQAESALSRKARALIAAANAAGGRDNITALLAHAPAAATRNSLMSRLLRT